MPILESRFQIYAIIQQSFNLVDTKRLPKKMLVLVGHSMGGIIARLLVSDADLTPAAMKLFPNRRVQQF